MNNVDFSIADDLAQDAFHEAYVDAMQLDDIQEEKEEILYWAKHLVGARRDSKVAI